MALVIPAAATPIPTQIQITTIMLTTVVEILLVAAQAAIPKTALAGTIRAALTLLVGAETTLIPMVAVAMQLPMVAGLVALLALAVEKALARVEPATTLAAERLALVLAPVLDRAVVLEVALALARAAAADQAEALAEALMERLAGLVVALAVAEKGAEALVEEARACLLALAEVAAGTSRCMAHCLQMPPGDPMSKKGMICWELCGLT